VPDDPAFVFLGASPKRIANPGTLPALGLALADGIDVDGHVNAGLAISFLPTSLVRYRLTPEKYWNGRPSFWLYNTQISVGTVRKGGDAPATDLAFGLRTIFLGPEPYSDPGFRDRMAGVLDRCLTESAGVDTSLMVIERRTGARPAPVRDSARPTRILPPHDGTIAGQDTVRIWKAGPNTVDRETAIECGTRGRSRVVKAWMNNHWNDATLALSAATGTRFDRSAVRRRASLGTSLWLATGTRFDRSAVRRRASLGSSLWLVGAIPIRLTRTGADVARRTNLGQIAAQLHYVSIPGGIAGIDDSSWEGGIRAMAGKATVNGFVERTRNLKKSEAREDRSSWAAGVEFMVAESAWISAGVGERYASLLDANRDFVFLNLKWGLGREARLGR